MAVCLSGGWYVFTAWTSRLIYTAVISSAWLSFCSQSFQISDVLQKEFGAYNFEELEDYLYNVEISSEPIVSMAENHEKENSEKEPHVEIADDAQVCIKLNLPSLFYSQCMLLECCYGACI